MDWMQHAKGDVFRMPAQPPGLGTRIATILRWLGVERLVQRLRPQGCGCKARQAWLDRRFPLRWLKKKRKR